MNPGRTTAAKLCTPMASLSSDVMAKKNTVAEVKLRATVFFAVITEGDKDVIIAQACIIHFVTWIRH